MDIKKLTSELEQMKGNSYQYAKQVHTVTGYRINEERFVLITNLNEFSRKTESAEEFFKYWFRITQEVENKNENNEVAIYIEQEQTQANDLILILKDNISKVQADPKYIPQAQEINDNVNTIINIQKMKLDYVKQFRLGL